MGIKTFTVHISQYVEETAELVVKATNEAAARATVLAHIEDGTLDEAFCFDWADGNGSHDDGISISMVEQRT